NLCYYVVGDEKIKNMGFLHVQIDDDLKRRFKTICVSQDRKMGDVVTELIDGWLQEAEDKPSSKEAGEKKA
ncbi:MAG: plasmid partition protein ParG, partial [Geitlerinemataceae cyanobacterium]